MSKKFEFVTVNNVPIRVDSWGGVLPSDIRSNPQKKPKELILVIPGNPGVTRFYDDFLSRLYDRTNKKMSIWIISHAGHDKNAQNVPPLKHNQHLFNLQGQVEQKKRFIETYLSNVELHLIGHSIGCKMILDILKSDDSKINIKKCYFLFPTIERMVESPNGKLFTFAYKFLWLILLGSFIFVNLPSALQKILVKCYFWVASIDPSNIPAMFDLIDPKVVRQAFFLADDEMKSVRELDHDTIYKASDKLKLYYGTTDGWVPVTYYEELKRKHRKVDAELCSQGIKHAFPLQHSVAMADILISWIQL